MLDKMVVYSGIGTAVGAVAGLFVGAPSDGAKIGASIAMQVVSNLGTEKIKEKIVDKACDGVDSAGRKVEQIVDKTGEAVQKAAHAATESFKTISERASEFFMDTGYVWSTITLAGYVARFTTDQMLINEDLYRKNCAYFYQDLPCLVRGSVLSTSGVATVAMIIAMVFQVQELVKIRKKHAAGHNQQRQLVA